MRTLDIYVCSVLEQQGGQVGLAEVEGSVERRLTAESPGVQFTATVDKARQDLLEVDDVVVHSDSDMQWSDSVT